MRTAFTHGRARVAGSGLRRVRPRGHMIAQSLTGTPGHINAMATGVRHFLAAYPPATLEPGDVLITNDPWMTAGQINESPWSRRCSSAGAIVAYFANTCHAPDIGGRMLSAEAREVYEEGLRIPITKLFIARRAERGAARDDPRQRPHARRDGRRPVRAGRLQRRRRAQPAAVHGRVRPGRASSRCPTRSSSAPSAPCARRSARCPNGVYAQRGLERRLRRAGPHRGGGDDRRRRGYRDRLRRLVAAEPPRHQRGAELHPRLRRRSRSRRRSAPEVPHNEGAFRPVHVDRAGGLDPELRAAGARSPRANGRPLAAGRDLRRAGAGDAGPADGRRRRARSG